MNFPVYEDFERSGISVRIWRKKGANILCGYAVGIKDRTRSKNARTRTRVIKNEAIASIKEDIDYLAAKIEKEYSRRIRATNLEGKETEGIFTSSFNEIGNTDPHYLVLCKPSWKAKSTRENNISYFRNNILPYLDRIGPEITDVDLIPLCQELISIAAQSRQGHMDLAIAECSVSPLIVAAQTIYNNLRMQTTAIDLPELTFPSLANSAPRKETIKSLPDDVRKKIFRSFVDNVSSNRLVLAASLMFFGGLRTAEAAAANMSSLEMHEGFAVFTVERQYSLGKITSVLKTNNSYRKIVLPFAFCELLKMRVKRLEEFGYGNDEIAEIDFVADHRDADMNRSFDTDLSTYVRKTIEQCGFTIDSSVMQHQMKVEPDLDGNGKPSHDICAYILRRDWCTRATSICGIRPNDVDYLLGHEPQQKRRTFRDYNHFSEQERLAQMLERYVVDISYTRNPLYCPIVPLPETDDQPIANIGFVFSAKERTKLKIRVSCIEPVDSIQVICDSPIAVTTLLGRKDNPESREVRSILGCTQVNTDEEDKETSNE